MSSITYIEKVAERLDAERTSRLQQTTVDFDAYLQAREDDIGRIKVAEGFRDGLIEEFFGDERRDGLTLPWPKSHDKFLVRPGEVTVWAGFNGHMKSMVTGYVMLHLMLREDQKCCVASFEMRPTKTLRRMASQALGMKHPTEPLVHRYLDALENRLFLYDQQGEVTPERLLGVIYYCAEQLGVTQFVVDSLMKVVANEDDYNGQKKFIGRLCAAAKDLNIHIHLVHHSRKRDDESRRPGKQDAKGTGAIVDQCDNFVTVYKFPVKDGEPTDKPTHGLYVDKQRHGEWEGLIALWFDEKSLQFRETNTDKWLRFVE
ncbi:MAG: AAA family ATPase [bacterium]|jgi:twinkle protein